MSMYARRGGREKGEELARNNRSDKISQDNNKSIRYGWRDLLGSVGSVRACSTERWVERGRQGQHIVHDGP